MTRRVFVVESRRPGGEWAFLRAYDNERNAHEEVAWQRSDDDAVDVERA